jgi:hypothetical protein
MGIHVRIRRFTTAELTNPSAVTSLKARGITRLPAMLVDSTVYLGPKNVGDLCRRMLDENMERERATWENAIFARVPHVQGADNFISPNAGLLRDCTAVDTLCGDDDDACTICLENKAVIAFVPCGHMFTCIACTRALAKKECPTCRAAVTSVLKIFK